MIPTSSAQVPYVFCRCSCSRFFACSGHSTARQEACALVDASDAFDPESAIAAGIDLKRLLWVRCRVPGRVLDRMSGRVPGLRVPGPCEARAGIIGKSKTDPGAHVEQALKTADLLLQSGGFGVVVLDLSDVPPAIARRVPLTSWFRFRRAVENTPTVLLALEQQAYAKAAASLVLGLARRDCHWKAIAGSGRAFAHASVGRN